MEDLQLLVVHAKKGDLDAFATIVERFQSMAFGCSYAILRDFHLAQDVAQEAFLQAYLSLPRLRQPETFPGWFRRIVVRCCNRITRRKTPPVAPLEAAKGVSARHPGPEANALRRELRGQILDAVDDLPLNERMVTMLFYISEHPQKEVAQFLELPVTTVNNRLNAARTKLRKRLGTRIAKEWQEIMAAP